MAADLTAITVDGAASRRPIISPAALEWAQEKRKISQATLERLGVGSGTVFFPDLDKKAPAIVFKYRGGWKARAFPEKSFVAGKGFTLSFWNEDAVLRARPDTVWLTEGEPDACALVEAGIDPDAVLSVPNGAQLRRAGVAEDAGSSIGYAYVDAALKAGLNATKRFIWCGDDDEAGLTLQADMARILGMARFFFVRWPEGCKDPNDVLIAEGTEYLRELVTEGMLPWPIQGLYRLHELPEPAPLTLWSPGFPEWESKVFLAPRTLSVVTGNPGHGKTQMWGQIWYQIVKQHEVGACIASFETRPKPHLRRELRTLIIGKLERHCTEEELRRADAWINDWYVFLVHPEQRPSLEWFLDMAEVAVVRHGCRIIQLDPWNRLEASRAKNENETDYIGRCLRTLYAFAMDMGCHVQIVAHPAKMEGHRRGKPPDLEDVSGSRNWENMVDQGFVVHRPTIFEGTVRKTEATLYHRKARFEELGYPCKLSMNFDISRGRYYSTDYQSQAGLIS